MNHLDSETADFDAMIYEIAVDKTRTGAVDIKATARRHDICTASISEETTNVRYRWHKKEGVPIISSLFSGSSQTTWKRWPPIGSRAKEDIHTRQGERECSTASSNQGACFTPSAEKLWCRRQERGWGQRKRPSARPLASIGRCSARPRVTPRTSVRKKGKGILCKIGGTLSSMRRKTRRRPGAAPPCGPGFANFGHHRQILCLVMFVFFFCASANKTPLGQCACVGKPQRMWSRI